jgi:hypothetical protein
VFIADCDFSFNANYTAECLLNSIGFAANFLAKFGRQLPEHVHIQLDNTTSHNKNSYILKMLISMISLKMWTSASMGFLRVGHTHEDVGAIDPKVNTMENLSACFTLHACPMTQPQCAEWFRYTAF